ncbi:unnamed protein product [Parascedosporium putredinis]|uniref:Macro domain-containing protein n=1 Tax=Parascedosporium putredinis TaxID=1442378 RepID=A0A9P1GYG1_9PEZI|nr:unnamed protein product [Parascedosporium putredinis]CAI7991719.1 unnamed protein product [Parascedosporium putredinis]
MIPEIVRAHRSRKQPVPPSQSFNDRVSVYRGDITKLEVGAIVNAANGRLLGGRRSYTPWAVYKAAKAEEAKAALAGCYQKSLELAAEHGCGSVAFSSISTGIYGYPSLDASRVAAETTRKFLEGPDGDKLTRVIFVTFETKDVEAYGETLPEIFPPTSS